jgi:hypothetical protein
MDTHFGRIADDDAVLVFNYGDPSYRTAADTTVGLTTAEEIFLRLIASLVFAESVCIPARHIIQGRPMAEAIRWAAPLLEAGAIRPARRRVVPSFEDYALESRPSIDPAAVECGRFLDRATRRSYLFDEHGMAATNKAVFDGDLRADGAFRRVVVGGPAATTTR